MKEIGGYFEFESLLHHEYYSDLIALNNGRNCLAYLIEARNIKKLYIPYFLCDCIKDICKVHGCSVEKYRIDRNLKPLFEKELCNSEYLYIINYYGQIKNDEIIELKDRYKNIIFDNAQAFFQRPVNGIDTLYTCRKYFGVPDGAYLSTDIRYDNNIETDLSKTRMAHILGRYEGAASDYYKMFVENENSFIELPIRYMSHLTHNILGAIDYERVLETRNKNFEYLESELGVGNQLKPKKTNGAFAYPYYTENGEKIRQQLIQNKIYVATLWKEALESTPKDWIEHDFAVNLLPLPCDQRYQREDMKFVVDILLKNMG